MNNRIRKTTPKTAKTTTEKAIETGLRAPRQHEPYTVELVHIRPKAEPVRHYVYVYSNGPCRVIELHRQDPPSRTSQIGFYGLWTLAKVKADRAVTEFDLTINGTVTRYIALTRMARKLERDIVAYEAQKN